MKKKILVLLIALSSLIPGMAAGSEGKKHQALSQREQSIIPIAAFTADGDLERLVPALNRGLDEGLSINEIKEVMVHLYAYTGFPRSLNALNTFMKVVDERKTKGIEDVQGKTAGPVPAISTGMNTGQRSGPCLPDGRPTSPAQPGRHSPRPLILF